MDERLLEERQARKAKDDSYRAREYERTGLRVPHNLLKETRYEYWQVQYSHMTALPTREPAFWDELIEDARRR
eukprot:2061559-Heterocapsa_arctica.AAC.1